MLGFSLVFIHSLFHIGTVRFAISREIRRQISVQVLTHSQTKVQGLRVSDESSVEMTPLIISTRTPNRQPAEQRDPHPPCSGSH